MEAAESQARLIESDSKGENVNVLEDLHTPSRGDGKKKIVIDVDLWDISQTIQSVRHDQLEEGIVIDVDLRDISQVTQSARQG